MLISLSMLHLLEPTPAQRMLIAAREQVVIAQLIAKGMVQGHGKFDYVVREKVRKIRHMALGKWIHDALIPASTRKAIEQRSRQQQQPSNTRPRRKR